MKCFYPTDNILGFNPENNVPTTVVSFFRDVVDEIQNKIGKKIFESALG